MTHVQDGSARAETRLTVLQSSPDVGLDRFAQWLDVPVRLVRLDQGEPVPSLAEVGHGLLVLGGEMTAHSDAEAPWLPAVRALLAETSRTGVPTLGICLGAQLLAVARGGRVQVAAPPGPEIGVVDLRWRPDAAADALVGPLLAGRITPQVTWHDDAVVDLPSGAVWLASSAMYPYQAFRIGSAWGVQFHPEVSPATVAAWAAGRDDVDELDLVTDLAAREEQVTSLARGLAQRFSELVRTRADEDTCVSA